MQSESLRFSRSDTPMPPAFIPGHAAAAVAGLVTAAALGTLAAMFDAWLPDRLGLALWVGCALAALAFLDARGALPIPAHARVLRLPAAGLALALVWRDAPELAALDVLALLVLAVIALPAVLPPRRTRHPSRALLTVAPGDLGRGGCAAALAAIVGPVPLASQVSWREGSAGSGVRGVIGAAAGVVLAVPLLLLFGVLFASADGVFEHAADRLLDSGLATLPRHAMLAGGVAWLTAGLFAALGAPPAAFVAPAGRGGRRRWLPPWATVGTALWLVAGLFGVFAALQLPRLVGATAPGEASLAEYARRGFFELAWVAALVVPLLLGADALVDRRHAAERRAFRRVAGVLLLLLAVILASALQRMALYASEFGLTTLRIYVTTCMLWLAGTLGWLGYTVLRGRRRRFAAGALALGGVALLALHVLDPDALAVRVNAMRAERGGRAFDAAYAGSLSADAAPAVLVHARRAPGPAACVAARKVVERWGPSAPRTNVWTIGRVRARRAAESADDVVARCAALGF